MHNAVVQTRERSYYADGELKDYIFFGSALKYVALPSNVEVIPEGAFASSMIEEVALPEGLHTVSAYAFYGCTKLAAFHGRPHSCRWVIVHLPNALRLKM